MQTSSLTKEKKVRKKYANERGCSDARICSSTDKIENELFIHTLFEKGGMSHFLV